MSPSVFFCILLSILLILLLIKFLRLKSRIQQLRLVIHQMVKGDYSSRVILSPSDKFGDVALNVNELAESIQKRLKEITLEKDKLQAMLSSMAEGVLVISSEEHLIHVSPSFKQMFDVRSQDWNNKFYWEIIPNPIVNESIREVFRHKKVLRRDILISHPKEMFFNLQISPILDPNQKLTSMVAVFHDVTELKNFERLRTEFVANVSHELKTPLTSIKGFVETLRDGAVHDRVNAEKFLDIILKHTQRLENLVNDLLVISSLESKEIAMNFVKTDITQVIQSVLLLKKKQIEDLKHQLTVQIQPNLPLINIDVFRMEQVLINLLDNAIKFTPAGGKVSLKVYLEGGYVRIDIVDNGPGISMEYKDRIFERFFRVDKSRSQETGGTGLGLSIVKHIVEAHQGKVTVESVLGSGSTFSVFLK